MPDNNKDKGQGGRGGRGGTGGGGRGGRGGNNGGGGTSGRDIINTRSRTNSAPSTSASSSPTVPDMSKCPSDFVDFFNFLLNRIDNLQTDLANSRQQIDILDSRLAQSEQYNRRSTLVVSGFPTTAGETSESLKVAVCKHLSDETNLDVKESDIQALH